MQVYLQLFQFVNQADLLQSRPAPFGKR